MLKEDRQSHSPATSTSETVLTTLSTDMTPPSQQVSVSPKHIHVANLKSLVLVTCCDYVHLFEVFYKSTGHKFLMVWCTHGVTDL